MKLPLLQTQLLDLSLLQSRWKTIIDVFLSKPQNNGSVLSSVTLQIGSNTIDHKLGRKLQGWYVVRKRADAALYDTQDDNQTPELTLLLTSDAVVTVDLVVY